MDNMQLSKVLSRKMKSGDYCFCRILAYFPIFYDLYIELLPQYGNSFQKAFSAAVIEWNTSKTHIIEQDYNNLIFYSILEILSFKKLLSDMLKYQGKDYSIFASRVNDITLSRYKTLAEIVGIYSNAKDNGHNYSKIIYRDTNFKTKFTRFCNGSISLDNFIKKELKPQHDFLETFYNNMKKFTKKRLPIFMLTYDLKVRPEVKRCKKNSII